MTNRCHFRHTVTDQAGNAIQNAALYLYQPTTTTDPLGILYTAKTGGVVTNNPQITDASGQVEVWFDTPQSIDVLITSNTGTAFLENAPGTPLNWTSYRVSDEVRLAPEDSAQGFTFGTTTGVTAAASTDGTSLSPSHSDHAHAHGSAYLPDAHHTQAHGPADHSDVTRSMWFAADTMSGIGVSVSTVGGATDFAVRVLALPDAATNGGRFTFIISEDFASGFAIKPQWAPAANMGGAQTVRWQVSYLPMTAGTSEVAASTSEAWTGDSVNIAQDIEYIESGHTFAVQPSGIPVVWRVAIQRIGADGGDTNTQTVNLLGVWLVKTANQ